MSPRAAVSSFGPLRTLRRALATTVALTLLAPALARAQAPAGHEGMRLTAPAPAPAIVPLVADSAAPALAPTTLAALAAESQAFAAAVRAVPETERGGPVLVVSLNARRVWLLDGGVVRFTAPVAVGKGTGRTADEDAGDFATPRGRFVVTRRDSLPLWVPPDWHFAEIARKSGRPLRRLERGETIRTRDGSTIYVDGSEVMRRRADGTTSRMGPALDEAGPRELVVDGQLLVPPVGTTQRQYPRVLGARRLNLRDGYAFHGTDRPETVGRAASHGCLRMRDADVVALYDAVAVGTPVYLQ